MLQTALKMFGYRKPELEGKNVRLLMPNPFSQRHDSFLKNYMMGGEALPAGAGVVECNL